MIELEGYRIVETIHQGAQNSVHLGRARADDRPVVIKVARKQRDDIKSIVTLKHEYEITRGLRIPGVVETYDFEQHPGHAALIMEDFGGRAIRYLMSHRRLHPGIDQRLTIAIQVAETLGALHGQGIIHKDIQPANIIVNPSTLLAKLADFSISSFLSRERAAVSELEVMQSTLSYASPEQTGRMNRAIDYRTDYYSLGVSLYELFTGRLPFDSQDPMELVHCHIAKVPIPPYEIEPAIPWGLSQVIIKLLSKMPEDRYQSAFGLLADLRTCIAQIRGEVPAGDFIPGREDVPSQLQVSQKLYGRAREVSLLIDAFERVSGRHGAPGCSEMILIAGYSGIGKSSLVSEIHKPIARQGGYFVTGKFDQWSRNVPYASMLLAVRELVRQLLTESAAALERWKERILAAVGTSAQIIADVIPEVELIIGKQPPARPLGPAEARNRFNLTFRRFIDVFAAKERPLVLFLDDLQWADSASLDLLTELLRDDQILHLLVIGAYRNNDLGAIHPLQVLLDQIGQIGQLRGDNARIHEITLSPLAREHVCQLIADTLHCSLDRATPLADLLARKTHGNPFFLIQLLHDIYQQGLLSFDLRRGGWHWDMEQIEDIGITENVVEFMITKIRRLDPAIQQVLPLAACVGNVFDLHMLSLMNERSARETAEQLWPALEMGLIEPLSDDYKAMRVLEDLEGIAIGYSFLHDRVRQAAHALIPEEEQKRLHVRLGQLLLDHSSPADIEDNIFDIVAHLSRGAELIQSPERRRQAAVLNLQAAKRARDSLAYETAVQCLRTSIEWFGPDSWDTDYELTLGVYTNLVELEYLTINFDRAEALAEQVLAHARGVLDKIPVYETRIQFYVSGNKMQPAIDVALEVLLMLDVTLARTPPADLPSDDALLALPEMTDPYKLAAMRILMAAMPAAHIANPGTLPPIAFTMVGLCTLYGTSPMAAFAFALYGLIQCGVLGDIPAGYRFGKLALRLLAAFEATELESKVYALVNIFVRHWKEHARATIEPLLHGVRIGLETGDIEFAGHNAVHCCTYPLFLGQSLDTVSQEMQKYVDLSLKLEQQYPLYYIRIWRQLLLSLRDEGCDHKRMVGASFDERTMLPSLGENRASIFSLHLAKAMLLYYFGHARQAMDSARVAREYADAVAGLMSVVQHNFYQSLAILDCYRVLPAAEQIRALRTVDENQKLLLRWAEHAPENNRHKHDLVCAERDRALGSPLRAMQSYEKAIAGSRKHGFLHEEALAYELWARCLAALGHRELAQHQMTAAYRLYERWGAHAKKLDLVESHPQLVLAESPTLAGARVEHPTARGTGDSKSLDMTTVIKTSQALASEMVLGNLLQKLMGLVIEYVGAQIGVLALVRGGDLYIEAEGSADVGAVQVLQGTRVDASGRLPLSLVNYVMRTQERVAINDVARDRMFTHDSYILRERPQSMLCAPILRQGRLIGLFYFENNLSVGVFTPERLEVLSLLSSQVAISIENAQLYEQLEDYSRTLEQKVDLRTQELKEKNQQLSDSLQQIGDMQQQIIVQEKLASLGALTAGVAHEIKNPLNFVNNFAEVSVELMDELRGELGGAREQHAGTGARVAIDGILRDLDRNVRKIREHGTRIDNTVRGMLSLSRGSAGKREPTMLNELVAEYINLGYHGARAANPTFNISIRTRFDKSVTMVDIVPHDIGRVLLNLISNGCYAMHERRRRAGDGYVPMLSVSTRRDGDFVEIRVRDNGTGIAPEVCEHIFNPFYSTKPSGEGTGLGLSISHEIVVQEHKGAFLVDSVAGEYTEFLIRLPRDGGERALPGAAHRR